MSDTAPLPLTDDEIQAERAQTPGTAERVHFNHAGSSLMTRATLQRQIDHLELEARIGGYESKAASEDEVAAVYDHAAALVGGAAHEIALVENATVAWQQVFGGLTVDLGPGDRILTARAEYGANVVAYQQLAARTGAVVELIPDDEHGATSAAELAEMIDDRVRLVSVSHIPTNGGLINPAAHIGRVCTEAEVPYLLDACQSVGQIDLDVREIGCTALSVTGRKYLRGPRGTGFLWVDEAALERGVQPLILDHHGADIVDGDTHRVRDDARRFENWEFNYAAVLGLGTALAHANGLGMDRIGATSRAVGEQIRTALSTIDGVQVRDLGSDRGAICTFSIDGVDAADVKAAASAAGVNVSISDPMSTVHDAAARDLPFMVRASGHYLTTGDEIQRLLDVIEAVVS